MGNTMGIRDLFGVGHQELFKIDPENGRLNGHVKTTIFGGRVVIRESEGSMPMDGSHDVREFIKRLRG